MHTQLLRIIQQKFPLDAPAVALCQQYFEPIVRGKNEVLEAAGKVPGYLYFLNRGYTRLFSTDENGRTSTSYIGVPGTFFTSFLSFVQQQPAPDTAVCATDCELLRITGPHLRALIQASEAFKQFSLLIFEQAMALTAARAHDLATRSAEQRYQKLLSEQPGILQHLAMQDIASYLGMQPESLSRIRRQMS
ncbi:Crp/Fnr family transcriptional regulator [Hymenobacter metallilatus]|uniref:Crp/Fnr family transcriptional regulator n=1 Tax=Hymenobacter metallilatus TaxID=2493666 RepID=A0A3R9PF18_9BACT|nr:Crp/Fnr family transcriptional regulator [Hymenobacter metallilatus]RSK36077.1 Crp/Fnr family transcriptional regulator [Hymenobacter metallilatus]